jgi:hypothetical protein
MPTLGKMSINTFAYSGNYDFKPEKAKSFEIDFDISHEDVNFFYNLFSILEQSIQLL